MAEDTVAYQRLRRDVGASIDVLTPDIAEEIFAEAAEKYPDDTSKATAYTRVIALKGIRASAAMLGKYAQNQHQEDLTKVFDNLSKMLEDALAEVDVVSDPIETNVSPFFFGLAQGRRGR